MTITARIHRHNAAVFEATWSQADAIEWAKKSAGTNKRWPARCWRVEGAPNGGGNSKLLTQSRAEAVQRRYGGTVVRLIPTPTELGLPAMTINQSRVEGLPACPTCGALVDFPCRTPTVNAKPGKSRAPHAERVEAALPPPAPLPDRIPIHDGKPPHTGCTSLTLCDCNCRLCRKAWKEAGRPGKPKPPARRPKATEAPDVGTPPWGSP